MKTPFSALTISAMMIVAATSSLSENSSTTKRTSVIRQVQNPDFTFFRTHLQGKEITATRGVTSSSNVNSFSVRWTDDPDPASVPLVWWRESGFISSNLSRSCKLTHHDVFDGFKSYRIVAEMNNGDEVWSEISTEHIVRH